MKCLIAMVIVCACGIASAEPPATTQAVSGTYLGIRRIRITWTAAGPSADRLTELMNRHAAELAPKLINLPADSIGDWFGGNFAVGDHFLELPLSVNLPHEASVHPAAKEFLDDMVSILQDAVASDYETQHFQQITPLKEEAARAQQAADEASKRVNELRAQMRKLTGRADISTKTITEGMSRLEDESQKLELDIMAKTARRDALAKEIADQSDKVQQKIGNDAIAAELQKVVEARQAQVEVAKRSVAQGKASQTEAADAVGRAAEARAKLLERQRDAALEAGGDAIAALNRELLTLSVDLRELTARLEFVKARLPGLRDATDLLDPWERAERDQARAQSNLESANNELRQLNRRFASTRPPQFVVVESENRTNVKGGNAPSLFGGTPRR